jgi:drug/metabolite transporter (DMT)-like permease
LSTGPPSTSTHAGPEAASGGVRSRVVEGTSDAKHRATGVAMILFTLAGWTSIPLFLTHFKNDIDHWTANGWRYGFSALMWLPVLVWAWRRGTTPDGLWRAALWPSLFNIGAQVCFGAAPYFISPGLMTFSLRFQIVFLTIGAVLLFPAERRVITRPTFLAGAALLLAGTVSVLAFKEGGLFTPGELGPNPALGAVLGVGSGLLYAGYALCVRKFMHGMPALTAFAAVSQYTGAALVLLMLVLGDRAGAGALAMPMGDFSLLLLSAIIGIGVGHTLYYASIARLGLAVSSGVVQLQPVTVSIASMFLFGERLSAVQWACGVLAIAGAGLILYTQHAMATRAAREAERNARDGSGDGSGGGLEGGEGGAASRGAYAREP